MTSRVRAQLLSHVVLLLATIATAFIVAGHWRGREPMTLVGRVLNNADLGAGAGFVVVISPTCRYCEASVPFYRRLSAAAAESGSGISLHAVVPTPRPEAIEYLRSHDLEWSLSRLELQDLDISGTPTLLLVDSSRRVMRMWVGFLDRRGEAEVFDALRLLRVSR